MFQDKARSSVIDIELEVLSPSASGEDRHLFAGNLGDVFASIYNPANGSVLYDPDGVNIFFGIRFEGAPAVEFLGVPGQLAMTNEDFVVV